MHYSFFLYKQEGAFIQQKHLNRVYFYCQTKLYLVVCVMQEKNVFAQESLYYILGSVILVNQEHFSLVCKHKHIEKPEFHLTILSPVSAFSVWNSVV